MQLSGLREEQRVFGAAKRKILLSTTPSDSHTWNLVTLQLLIEEMGHQVTNLGSCVPVEVLIDACRRDRPECVVISTVNGHGIVDGPAVVRAVRADPELADLEVVIGGKLTIYGGGFEHACVELLAAGFNRVFDVRADGAEAAIAELREYLGSLAPASPGRNGIRKLPASEQSQFTRFIADQRRRGRLVLQPRMGFSSVQKMRAGLRAVRASGTPAIGTLTLDSYTRQNLHAQAAMAVESGRELNGYPLVTMGADRTAQMLAGVVDSRFPVQVRHGSPRPKRIFEAMIEAGLDASEGGPVSYCLPYSRTPLRESVVAWSSATVFLAEQRNSGIFCHLESFGGCMLGQLCPPGLLVALSVLEGLFFMEHGIASASLSYAQQTNHEQDEEALTALRSLAAEYLPDLEWHIVLYTYMGVYPASAAAAERLLADSVRLAVSTGTERLIVKTVAEAHRLPTIAENVAALRLAHNVAIEPSPTQARIGADTDSEIYQQAKTLIDAVLELAPRVSSALPRAFELGLLDVPFCIHPDNHHETECVIDADGRLQWWNTGKLPLPRSLGGGRSQKRLTAARLLKDLAVQQTRLDPLPVARSASRSERGEPK